MISSADVARSTLWFKINGNGPAHARVDMRLRESEGSVFGPGRFACGVSFSLGGSYTAAREYERRCADCERAVASVPELVKRAAQGALLTLLLVVSCATAACASTPIRGDQRAVLLDRDANGDVTTVCAVYRVDAHTEVTRCEVAP